MTDIIDRLRGEAHDDGFASPNLGDCLEGADEIERLRGLLAEVLDCIDGDDYLRLTMMFPRLIDKYYPEELPDASVD